MSRDQHRIIEIDEQQCHRLLERHATRLGRVAFCEDGDVDWPTILPINYTVYDGTIYFRTFEGSKLYAALRHQRVALEVDQINEEWREGWSVVAVGTLEVVRDGELTDVLDARLTSWAADSGEQLVRLSIQQLTGREIIGPAPAA